jgi:hypothetical protein
MRTKAVPAGAACATISCRQSWVPPTAVDSAATPRYDAEAFQNVSASRAAPPIPLVRTETEAVYVRPARADTPVVRVSQRVMPDAEDAILSECEGEREASVAQLNVAAPFVK